MSNQRNRTGLDEHRHGYSLHDDVSGYAGDAHAQDGRHDHDQEAGEVNIISLYHRENQVAHIEAHGGQGDGADDDADDDAAHTDGNRALRAFHGSFQNFRGAHAGFLADPASCHGDKDRNHGCIERREAGEHEADEADERQHQVALLFDDYHGVRNIFLRDTGEAQALRFEVNR